jgi:thiazolylpeptide-type bacteriocin precursor
MGFSDQTGRSTKSPGVTRVEPKESHMTAKDRSLETLSDEMLAIESETFSIEDYADVSEELLGSTSSSSTSCSSSTTSTTSCSA